RVGSHEGALRAVLDLTAEPGTHSMRKEGSTVVVELGTPSAPVAAAEEPAVADETPAAFLAVRDVRVEPAAAGKLLVIKLSRQPDKVKNFVLSDPPRLVIDLTGPQPPGGALTRFPLSDDLVTRVRVASNGNTLRVVADLKQEPGTYAVRHEDARVVAALGGAD